MPGPRSSAVTSEFGARPGGLSRRPRTVRRLAAIAAPLLLVWALLGPGVQAVFAAGVTMDARALLGGHTRLGSWLAIEIDVANDGPPVTGEVRLAAGAQGRTRYGVPVDLPTESRKSVTLYVQPPAFGDSVEVSLVEQNRVVATKKVPFALSDPSQTVVGVVAEDAKDVVSALRLPNNQNGLPAVIATLRVADLPERVEAWTPIDRLVWQDADTATLTPGQKAAMRGWIAGGGRLTIVGGTAGAGALAGLSDDVLPYRPTATIDIVPSVLSGMVGHVASTAQLPALAGDAATVNGTVLARSGDRVIAAERRVGSGAVTLVGFDPTGDWLARTPASDPFWNRLVPPRAISGPIIVGDDSNLVSALNNLPSLALPPVGGLVLLLAGYIVLVGPVNYFVLRRLDRREWAWLTMPLLVAGFAVAAFVYGNTLRGGQVIINQVAIVRGAPGTTDALAQVYLGVFSPERTTYQLLVPGGALVTAPYNSDVFGGFDGTGTAGTLDVLQGDTARVRDLAVGYGSLRAVRAEAPVVAPKLTGSVRLENDHLKGTVRNDSTTTLENPTVVLGSTVASFEDLAPGATATFDVAANNNPFGQALSDRLMGDRFLGGDPFAGEEGQITNVRQAILQQLSWDPMTGMPSSLGLDGPILLAFGRGSILDARVEGVESKTTGNILYYVPLDLTVSGKVTYTGTMMRATTLDTSAPVFNKGDITMIVLSKGTMTQSYRPAAFQGTIAASRIVLQMNQGGLVGATTGELVRPTGKGDTAPTPAEIAAEADGIPIVELFDLEAGTWMRLPHIANGSAVEIANPTRWVDPDSGTILVRFRSDRDEGGGFQFLIQLEGTVK